MTGRALHDEWLIAHRELQEIRAFGKLRPRKKMKQGEAVSRRRYAAARARKTMAAHREVARRRGEVMAS